ncbi:hypothetical protein E8E13_010818 [Curvularia kusanoi]|uniref:Protein kinase domain-containing protein n=1 Tax=Curvularia kusanoi TaxID=90978 RepID=A0A9P4TNB9_CURKU|nr:hypothetical protein E8E13_010818 [Curvularia kusanoi]
MYKLFRDMVLALDHLHHKLGTRYVHNDFKPHNVLVIRVPDYDKLSIPEEPTFKLADFARLAPWPTPRGEQPESFNGTPEYAPPEQEQKAPVQPSADIYGLGATLQYMALGEHPIQSQESFVRHRRAQGKTYPELMNKKLWPPPRWRKHVPTVFRPIDVSSKSLRDDYDFPGSLESYQPYGERLGYWYAQLWAPVQYRPKASTLVDIFIPEMDKKVERLKLQRLKELSQDE